MPSRIQLIFTVFLVLLFTAACGQKGPLFIPGDPSQIRTDIPRQSGTPPEDSTEESDDEDDDD